MTEAPSLSVEPTLPTEPTPADSPDGQAQSAPAPQPAEPPTAEAVASAKYRELVAALENPKEPLSASDKWQLVRDALNMIYADLVSDVRCLSGRVARVYDAAPAEYTRWIRCSLRSGLCLQNAVALIPPRFAQNTVVLLRPQLVGELQLETLTEEMQLDAALGQYAEYLRITLPVKAFDLTGRVRTDKQALTHSRITAAALNCLRYYDAAIERLRNRHQRRFPTVNIKAEGVAVQVNGFTGQPPADPHNGPTARPVDQLDFAEPS